MSLAKDRPVSDADWLRDGAERHRAGCRFWVLQGCDADADAICRFAVLCYRLAAGGRRFEGSFAVMERPGLMRGERRLKMESKWSRARKLPKAPACPLSRNDQGVSSRELANKGAKYKADLSALRRAGGVAWKVCEIR